MSPCSLRMPTVVAPNLDALAPQLSRNGLEEIWSPYYRLAYRLRSIGPIELCSFMYFRASKAVQLFLIGLHHSLEAHTFSNGGFLAKSRFSQLPKAPNV